MVGPARCAAPKSLSQISGLDKLKFEAQVSLNLGAFFCYLGKSLIRK